MSPASKSPCWFSLCAFELPKSFYPDDILNQLFFFSQVLALPSCVQACSLPISLICGDLYKTKSSQCPSSKDPHPGANAPGDHPVRGRKTGRAENSTLFTLVPFQLPKSMEKLPLGPYHCPVFDTQRAAPSRSAELNSNLGINTSNRFLVALP